MAHLRWTDRSPFGPHTSYDKASNPFRPGFSGDLLIVDYSPPHLFTVSIDALSRAQDPASTALSMDRLRELSVDGIDLSLIRAKGDSIEHHVWHPSGNYIAVQIGGLVYIIHWSSADIVAVIENAVNRAYPFGDWSPDGSLLRMDAVVWDCFTGEVRPLRPDEAWWPSSLTEGPNGKLFSTSGYGFRPPRGHWKDAAWWPTDPSYCASVGGEGAERFVQIWRTTK